MFRFFRQIRQRLVTGNQFGKYLLYAIGEILLIVIGIMIALQLDNHNEQRKIEATMVENLSELKLELESNMHNSHRILHFYSNRDSLIRQHLCKSITRDEVNVDIAMHWYLGVAAFMVDIDRDVLDKVLTKLENLPDDLADLKSQLRWLDGAYQEMEGNNDRLREITGREGEYRVQNLSWTHETWRWDRSFDADTNTQILDFILNDPHYKNQLQIYWLQVARNTVPDILNLRRGLIYNIETLSNYLDPSKDSSYQFPEDLRVDLTELVGTYRTFEKSPDGQQDIDMGEYVLFEEDGRLLSYTAFDPEQYINYQSEERVEWVTLTPTSTISPTGWFMHLVKRDTVSTALEYAGCNNRNLYFIKKE